MPICQQLSFEHPLRNRVQGVRSRFAGNPALDKAKGKTMQMIPQNQDSARARAFFEQKVSFTTGPVELDHAIKGHENIVIVDVREAEDYAKAHVPGAINLPKGSWDNPEGLQKNRTNIVYCYTQQCHLAANAC